MFSNKKTSKNPWIFIAFLAILLVSTIVDNADAKGLVKTSGNLFDWGENWQPSRGEVRLNLMGHWSDGVTSRLQGVCYDVMEKENKPYHLYFGPGLQCGSLNIEPTVGWSFRDNELVAALRAYLKWDKWKGYSNLEYQLETKSYYYLTQFETRITEWAEWGFEVEGWGDINDHRNSDGIGINLIFHLQGFSGYKHQDSKLLVEAAIQYREMDNEWKPQAIVRLIFTPKMDKHTPERRDRRGRRY